MTEAGPSRQWREGRHGRRARSDVPVLGPGCAGAAPGPAGTAIRQAHRLSRVGPGARQAPGPRPVKSVVLIGDAKVGGAPEPHGVVGVGAAAEVGAHERAAHSRRGASRPRAEAGRDDGRLPAGPERGARARLQSLRQTPATGSTEDRERLRVRAGTLGVGSKNSVRPPRGERAEVLNPRHFLFTGFDVSPGQSRSGVDPERPCVIHESFM